MQLAKGRQRDLRCANLESSTINRVHLPRRQDRHDTRRQLDVHKHARCTPLALNAPCAPPVQWMPAIVHDDILPDMGRMTARLLRPIMLGSGSQARVPGLPATRVLHDALSKVSVAAKRNPTRWAIAIGASLALFGGAYLGFEYSRWQATDRSRIEAEAKRRVDAVAAAKKSQDEKARADVELPRQKELGAVQEKRLADESARHAAELKKMQDERLAAQKAEEAKRQQDERATVEKKAAEARARQDAEAKTAAVRPINIIMYRRYDAGTLVTGNVRRMPTGEWVETNTRNSKWTFRTTEERANELILHDASRNVYVKMDLAAKRMFERQGAEGAWVYLADIVWTDK